MSGDAKFTNVARVNIVVISELVIPTPPRSVCATSIVEEMEAHPKNNPPPSRFWTIATPTYSARGTLDAAIRPAMYNDIFLKEKVRREGKQRVMRTDRGVSTLSATFLGH